MQQSPPLEANSHSATQQIPHFWRNPLSLPQRFQKYGTRSYSEQDRPNP